MKVIEVFNSIQGEGAQMGIPMTFVRLAGCNLRCPWCDTKYSWDESKIVEMSEKEIMSRCTQTWVCITGGEPLMQDFGHLAEMLKKKEHSITVETNGTISPTDKMGANIDFWTISPKGWPPKIAPGFPGGYEALQIKFVVGTIEQMKVQYEWVRQHRYLSAEVTFQPERYSHESDYMEFLSKMVDTAKDFDQPVRVLPQLHWLIWGGVKGK